MTGTRALAILILGAVSLLIGCTQEYLRLGSDASERGGAHTGSCFAISSVRKTFTLFVRRPTTASRSAMSVSKPRLNLATA